MLTSAAQFLEEVAVSLISEFVFLQEVPGRAPTPLQPQEEVYLSSAPIWRQRLHNAGLTAGKTCIFSALFLLQPTPSATHKSQNQTLLILEEKFKGPCCGDERVQLSGEATLQTWLGVVWQWQICVLASFVS